MKRIFSVFLLALCLFSAVLLCSGCSKTSPIVFNSVLTINTDESGCRTITASASKETIKSILGGKNNSFQSFVDAHCPSSVNWEYIETGETYELTFNIPFETLDVYQTKVGTLTGNSSSVTISRPQVGVKTGFTLTESTNITDLFSWLFTALSERSGISQSKLANKLINGSNLLIYAGREYPQKNNGLYAYIETLHDAERIDILTEFSLDNTCSRTVIIQFPGEMLHNAANVKPYLTSLLPAGISESWTSSTVWSLTFESGSIDAIGTLMDGLFQSQTDKMLNETIYADNAMRFTHHYQEPLNLAFFVPNTGSTTVRYFVKTPDHARLFLADGSDGLSEAYSLSNAYAGYTCLFDQPMSNGMFDFTASYQYQPVEIVIDTQVRGTDDIRRTTTLEMGESLPEIHRSLMIETLTKTAGKYGSLKEETNDQLYRILFSQSGSAEHINEGFAAVFRGSASFSYQRPKLKLFDATLKASYSDRIDLSSFLSNPSETLITYHLGFPNRETLSDGTESLISLTTDGLYQLNGDTIRPNQLRPWIFGLFTLLGLFILFRLSVGPIRKAIIRRQRNKRRQISKKYPQKKKRTSAKRKPVSGSKPKNSQKKSTSTRPKNTSRNRTTKTNRSDK